MPGCSWLVIQIHTSDLEALEAQATEKGIHKNALAIEDVLDGIYWREKDGVNWKENEKQSGNRDGAMNPPPPKDLSTNSGEQVP